MKVRAGAAVVSLLAGTTLYVGGRPPTLRLFQWTKALGLGAPVELMRAVLAPTVAVLPDWVVYSLPFGLWVLSLTLLLRDTRWAAVGLILGLGAELAQLLGAAPGTFDPTDLAVLVACGVLGLVGRTSGHAGHLRPATATLAFAVLAAGTSESEEQKAERLEKEKQRLEELGEYTKTLKTLHDTIAALDLNTLEKKSCKGVKVELPDGSHGLRTLELPFLARFEADKSAWTKNDGPWKFLNDSTFAGHFAEHQDDRESYGVQDTAKRVKETFLPEKYLIVIAPIKGGKTLPEMKKDHFLTGELAAWVFLGDQTSGEIACQVPFAAGSSESIDFGGLLDGDDPEKEMMEDFEDNIEEAIEAVLHGESGSRAATARSFAERDRVD